MDLEYNTFLRDRYRVEKQLGKGGMGAVYLALDTVLQTKVAVKINQNPRQEGRDQFLQEARLLAGLRHPNLPRVIDYFVIEDSQYLVMDFIPGDDLGTIVKREGKQEVDKVLYWAKQLGKALNYLHTQEPPVIHRDIKPGNIKITPRGEVILVDFGIAKSSDITQETYNGARGLTPGYSPPEQYGSGRTGHYSDQFGLAATLYNVLTNEKPVDAVERLLGQATLKPIHELNPDVPPHVEEVITRALSIKPEDRYGSILEFVQALGQSSIPGPDETMIAPVRTMPTPKPQPVINTEATRVGASSPIPSTPISTPVSAPPSYPISQPAPKQKSKMIWVIPVVLIVGAIVLFGGGWFVWNTFLAEKETPPPATANVVLFTETSVPIVFPVEESTPTYTPEPIPNDTQEPTSTDIPEPTIAPTQSYPSIGRDGIVAYVSDVGDGETFQLWTMKVYQQPDGTLIAGDPTQMTTNPGSKSYPNWSPDGTKIVFSAETGDTENKIDLYTINVDGSGLSNLIAIPGNETEAAWSPDGQWIVFTIDNRTDGIKQLMIVRPNGTELRRLSSDKQEFSPEWSPKMDRLVYVLPSSSLRYLWMRDPQNDFVDLDRDMFFMRLKYMGDPAWSPDAVWMAYTNVQGRTQDVYLTRIQSFGMEVKRLTNTTFDSYPAWSPDSKWILFQSNRDTNMEIYIMDIDGQNQTNLTLSPDSDEMHPAWQLK
jgi:serine/threonine protein kinase